MDEFFDKLGDGLATGTKFVGDKAKEIGNAANLQLEIHRNEVILNEEYAKLGRKYYEEHKGEDPAAFQTIEATKRNLAHLKKQLSGVKKVVVCKACGAENPEGSAFCNKCGEAL